MARCLAKAIRGAAVRITSTQITNTAARKETGSVRANVSQAVQQVPGCVSFSLTQSGKDWDDVKLYSANATLVPNPDWVMWQRKS